MPIDTVKMRLQVRIVAIATFIIMGTELYNMDIFMIDLSFSAEIQGTKLSLFLIFVYLQVQGFDEARKPFGRVVQYSGILNAFKTIWIDEKIYGFFKGSLPGVIKASLAYVITYNVE